MRPASPIPKPSLTGPSREKGRRPTTTRSAERRENYGFRHGRTTMNSSGKGSLLRVILVSPMGRSTTMASRLSSGFPGIIAGVILITCGALAQERFPAGTEGELYYCPRIDLNPVKDGGPLTIELDGILDEPFWERVQFQKWSVRAGEVPTPDHSPPEEDIDLSWGAVADKDYLYVAWRVVDDARMASETFFCNVWQDDSVEVYLDALNDGPSCPTLNASCYGKDDAQLTIGADQVGK